MSWLRTKEALEASSSGILCICGLVFALRPLGPRGRPLVEVSEYNDRVGGGDRGASVLARVGCRVRRRGRSGGGCVYVGAHLMTCVRAIYVTT